MADENKCIASDGGIQAVRSRRPPTVVAMDSEHTTKKDQGNPSFALRTVRKSLPKVFNPATVPPAAPQANILRKTRTMSPTLRQRLCALALPLAIALVATICCVGIFRCDKAIFQDFLIGDDVFDEPTEEAPSRPASVGHTVSYAKKERHKSKANEAFIPAYPRRKAPTPKIHNQTIFFLHIHKSGGTSMCRLAKKNRMTVNYRRNCNVQKDQHCCGDEDTLEAQQAFAASTNFSFVASEKHMYKAMDPQGYYYAVILRDSKARYMSHYRHVNRLSQEKDLHVGTFDEWWTSQPDNWNVRMICGADCADTSKYKISRGQWEETLARLALFGSIMFLENFANSFRIFALKVGWPSDKIGPKEHHNKGKYEQADAEMGPLMTALDGALYEYAQQMMGGGLETKEGFLSETQAAIDKYFEQRPSQNCSNPCCGECSKY